MARKKPSRQQMDDFDTFYDNQMIYWFYVDRISQVAVSQFDYGNTPDTTDMWFFEWKALTRGTACWCAPLDSDDVLSVGWIPHMRPEDVDRNKPMWDVYGYPTGIKGIGWCNGDMANGKLVQGASYEIDTDDFVILYDNMGRMSMMNYIHMWARRLWECHMVIRANRRFQNIPYLIRTRSSKTNDLKLTIDNLFMDLANFKPVIELRDNIKVKGEEKEVGDLEISTLDLRVDYRVLDMWKDLKLTWAECLSMLGITTQYSKKSQYQNEDELMMDRMIDDLSLANRLKRRVEFCNKVNKKWSGTPKLPNGDVYVNLAPNTEWYKKAAFPMDMVVRDIDKMKSSTSTFL